MIIKNFAYKIFAYILVLIALAVNVYAQPQTAGITQLGFLGAWQWFIVNALIIFTVLFMLQAALITEKLGKERSVAWILTLAISLVISWLISSNGFIWEHPKVGQVFRLPVLTNTVVILLVIYIILGVAKVQLPQSSAGKTGVWILVGLIALMAGLKMGDNYIWNVGSIKAFVDFLFGAQGILTFNQNRIIVFVTTAAIFVWLFAFLEVAKEQKFINYALAIVISANLASGSDPVSLSGVVKFGHIVGTLVLGRNLAEQLTGKWKLAGYAGAFFLLWWAINAAAPGHGLLGGLGETIFGEGAEETGVPTPTKAKGPSSFLVLLELLIIIIVIIVAYKYGFRLFSKLFRRQQTTQQGGSP